MKLLKVLDSINQIEKSSFLRILDGFCNEFRKSTPQIDKILSEGEGQLKNVDNSNIASLFYLLEDKYKIHLQERIKFSDYQFDLISNILIRDGNSIMSREWFSKLYTEEISQLEKSVKEFKSQLLGEVTDLAGARMRDYSIYQSCVKTAYENDLLLNRDMHLSWEEKSILNTLSMELQLSNEEVRLITYTIIPIKKFGIDDIIGELKENGIIFFNRRSNTLFIPDEIVWLIRSIMGIELPNKYVRRILRNLSDPEINLVCRKHNMNLKLSRNEKIQAILDQGISVFNLLTTDIYRDSISKIDRSERVLNLMQQGLEVELTAYGRSLGERVNNLIGHFLEIEKDESIPLSHDGYDTLLKDIKASFPQLNSIIKNEFQLQPDDVMLYTVLEDYNIKPRDILYLLTTDQLKSFCKERRISERGNKIRNVVKSYRSIEDLYIESIELIGNRDLKTLREKGLSLREVELGKLYEDTVKKLFAKLGFDVDESLRKKINTKTHQMDILLNMGKKDVIIVECKTVKDKEYNKYAQVSRQLKSYQQICQNKGYHVMQVMVAANDFSEEFISECEYDYELNLSLITSNGLVNILSGLRSSKHEELPVRLLLKGGLLSEERIINVLKK